MLLFIKLIEIADRKFKKRKKDNKKMHYIYHVLIIKQFKKGTFS